MPSPGRNPYPGLRPFRADETALFFGRESQVDAMVDKLAATRFLAVVGSSGCGKSSLVTCGLRPALQRGLMASAGSAWRIATCRPGADPVASLAQALAAPGVLFDAPPATAQGVAGAVEVPRAALVEATLRLSKRGLVDLVEQAQLAPSWPAGLNLLLVVDQFEELFRYRALALGGERAAQDAVALVNLLLEATQAPGGRVYVVLTMRSDFLGDCTQFSGLAEAINAGQYLVPRLTRDERRSAIAGPAAVAGAQISPTLLTRLVNDVGDNPDQLSLLQHALNRTYAGWQTEQKAAPPSDTPLPPLTLSHYEAIGGMAHALDRHAERAFAELTDPAAQTLAERIFKALTDRAADPRGVRRPTRMDSLCAITQAAPEAVTAVVDVFRKPSRSFLMPPAGQALTPDSVLDISHESLMRVWERCKRWTEDEAASAQHYQRLAETAALHAAKQAGLWRDPDLQIALDWRKRVQPNPAWADRYAPGFDAATAFLDLSRTDRDAEVERDAEQTRHARQDQLARAKAEAHAELQAGSARRMRWFAWGAGTMAVLAMASTVVAFRLTGQAQARQAELADAKAKVEAQAEVLKATVKAERDAKLKAAEESVAYKRLRDAQSSLVNAPTKDLLRGQRGGGGGGLGSEQGSGPNYKRGQSANPADPGEQPKPAAPRLAAATLYIQVQTDEQGRWAEQVRQQSGDHRLSTPKFELVRAGPRVPELRYYHQADKDAAQAAIDWLKTTPGLDELVIKRILQASADDRAPIGQMELWYGWPKANLLVLAGSFSDAGLAKARAQLLIDKGLAARVADSRSFPNLRDGAQSVVVGPYASDAEAKAMLDKVQPLVKDAYVKSGW